MQLPSFNIFGWGQASSLLPMFTQQPAQSTKPSKDVQSLMNIGRVRAEIELLVDVIFYKHETEQIIGMQPTITVGERNERTVANLPYPSAADFQHVRAPHVIALTHTVPSS
ncbi:unnamed protein product [Prunus armeniaca]